MNTWWRFTRDSINHTTTELIYSLTIKLAFITWSLCRIYQNDMYEIDPDHRLYAFCLEIENGEHFVTNCQINDAERQLLFTKISSKFPVFAQLNHHEKLIYLMSCKDRQILTWLRKVLYKSFDIRNTKIYDEEWSNNAWPHNDMRFTCSGNSDWFVTWRTDCWSTLRKTRLTSSMRPRHPLEQCKSWQ